MKMMKAFKKLWPKKKKKKKHQEHHCVAPSPCYGCCCPYSNPVQPSAPPLPPWVGQEQSQDTITAAELEYQYQQYADANAVYGVPLLQPHKKERPAQFIGYVTSFGANLINCFTPCFGMREVQY